MATLFVAGLYVCEMAFCLGWIYRQAAPRAPLPAWLFGTLFNNLVWLFSLAFFIFLGWYRRKKRAELPWLLTLRDPNQQDVSVG